ncbi:glycoside hydrolase family 79 protein [Niveomyces insectorum RCEF 264]|uniref:Glycoside hydrolase family 79 protein n=1 Tax=Niveomyces insectorum RCEF 264 TaxID=1081102 RepID=A0A167N060_9HYPO|nr:glycoside hydrolase family 79 protein [Niveomyces insectorum RCEF 264]
MFTMAKQTFFAVLALASGSGTNIPVTAAASVAPVYNVSAAVPAGAGTPLLDAFVSYSIEFVTFPDYAGNASAPNTFSDALLANLGDLMGSKPYIRVGGNTQDYALYNASLPWAVNGTFNRSRSADYPTTVAIGPSFFESYRTWAGVRFSHGFNLALAPTPAGWQTLLATVPLVCQALGPDGGSKNGSSNSSSSNSSSLTHHRLYTWEYGNEPDLLSTSAQGPTRPPMWNESTYVAQWRNGTRQIWQLVQQHCPDLVRGGGGHSKRLNASVPPPDYAGFMAPSFAGTNNHLKALATWQAGLGADDTVALFSTHNYISGATSPGVTLQGTLLNHTNTVQSVHAHVAEYQSLVDAAAAAAAPGLRPPPRQILGETNSLYNEGRPGLSNTFGAALWGLDFLLACAAAGVGRVHMHQGTNYRYVAWQPIETANATRGTKPPYYGNVAAAAALGDTGRHNVSVLSLSTTTTTTATSSNSNTTTTPDVDVAYAIYVDGRLARVLVLNLRGYNTTAGGTGLGTAATPPPPPRPSRTYTFAVAGGVAAHNSSRILVQRLLANGSDAISGVTWDGWSYNLELAGGKPVRLPNVTVGERLPVQNGHVTVSVTDSSAALLHF